MSEAARVIGRLCLYLVPPVVVAVICYFGMKHTLLEAVDPSNSNPVVVEVQPGSKLRDICDELQKKGLVRYGWSISVISRFKGEDRKIDAGEYSLSPNMTPREILAKLVSGEVVKRKLLLREGMSVWELGPAAEEAGLIKADEINIGLVDPNLLMKAGIAAKSFEGYLFPDTYFFSRPVTSHRVIWTMMEQAEKRWKPEWSERAIELNLNRHEVLTLASIIEKESGNVDEQPLISSVFHNRLKKGMKLESDPTVVYGIKDFDGIITKKHLRDPHPYNTYVNFGLPPGPICNPGETSIKAALYPDPSSQYEFFVADGRGGHVFSVTLKEHQAAVQQYRAFLRGEAVQDAGGADAPNGAQ